MVLNMPSLVQRSDSGNLVSYNNKLVLYDTKLPESTLKKKNNSIVYHDVREVVATGEWLTGYEPMDTNVSDLLTKPVPGGKRRNRLVRVVMYYI